MDFACWNDYLLGLALGGTLGGETLGGRVAEEMGTSTGRAKANYVAVPANIAPGVYFGIVPDAANTRRIVGMDGRAA